MIELPEELQKKVDRVLDAENWRGYMCGLAEGSLSVLYEIDLDMEERMRIFKMVTHFNSDTVKNVIEAREIEDRINKKDDFSYEEKEELLELMTNKEMEDETVLACPQQTMALVSSFSNGKFIKECLPQVDIWIENGEQVSMSRIREWLIDKYDLL